MEVKISRTYTIPLDTLEEILKGYFRARGIIIDSMKIKDVQKEEEISAFNGRDCDYLHHFDGLKIQSEETRKLENKDSWEKP